MRQFDFKTQWYCLIFSMICCGLVANLGCQTTSTTASGDSHPKWLPKKKPDPIEEARLRPTKMVAIWSESVVFSSTKKPTRGLGGRIYFYNERHQTIPAEGELIVYAFDDNQENEDAAKRKYIFSPEQFAGHFSQSDFGPSYSVWIPWDDVGNAQQPISVVPMFKTKKGQMLVGDYARNLLNGKKKTDEQLVEEESGSEIRRVGFQEKEKSNSDTKLNIRTSTIELPATMRHRVMSSKDLAAGQRYRQTTAADRMERLRQLQSRPLPTGSQPERLLERVEQVGRPIHGRPRLQPYPSNAPSDPQASSQSGQVDPAHSN